MLKGSESSGNAQIVKGMIPLSEMFDLHYITFCNTGRGTFSVTTTMKEDVP